MPDTIRFNRQRTAFHEKNPQLLPLLCLLFSIMVVSGLFVLWHIQRMTIPGNISSQTQVMQVGESQKPIEDWLAIIKSQPQNSNNAIMTGSDHSIYLIWIPKQILNANMERGGDLLYLDHPNFITLEAYWQEGDQLVKSDFNNQAILPFLDLHDLEKTDHTVNVDGLLIRAEAAINTFTISIVDRSDYYELQNWLLIYMQFAIGIIFAAFILDAALVLILKEKAFAFHALYLASVLLYMYTSSGLSRIALFDFKYYFFIFGFSTVLSAVWIIDWYLNYKKRMPVYHVLSRILIVLGAVVAIACPFLLGSSAGILQVYKLLIAYGIISAVWAIVSLSLYLKQYDMFSLFFVIGSLFQALTVPLLAYGTTSDNDYTLILKLLYMLAAAVNAVFYTLGIIHESRSFKEESEYYFKMSITDPLTGAYNRFFIDAQLEHRLQNNLIEHNRTCYMLIDIDRFKAINDQYGHEIGDHVLIELVNILKTNIRRTDLLSRWGGEEFAILLDQTELNEGIAIAESLRRTIESHDFSLVAGVTISIGVTSYQQSESLENWFNRTDKLLYLAKNSGRNCVKGA